MENALAHGIGVKNRYALFYDEDVDPLEILRQQEEEKQKRKTDKTQPKEKGKSLKSTKPALSTGSPKKPLENLPVKTPKVSEGFDASNKVRGKPPGERFGKETKEIEERKNFRNRDDQFHNAEPRERDPDFRRGRGGFRGRRERGRGYFANPEGSNRRVFDRHSGSVKTGVRHVDKRDGAGPNNWGDIKSDINQKREETTEVTKWDEDEVEGGNESMNWSEGHPTSEKFGKDEVKVHHDGEGEGADTKENEPIPDEPIEETVKEMTLDEWKKEQEAKRVVPKYNLRKPGEGEDNKQWKKGYVLVKKAKEEDEDQDEEEDDDDDYARKGHRQLLDIQINFSDSRRGSRGRGRGGRGGMRGAGRDPGMRDVREDRGRGGGREARDSPRGKVGQQSAPRVDDWNDFPSLVNA